MPGRLWKGLQFTITSRKTDAIIGDGRLVSPTSVRVNDTDVHPIDYDGVPRITYSDPEVASAALTSAQVAERGLENAEVNYPPGGNGRSVILPRRGWRRSSPSATWA